jgi:hypothetical protein
MNVEKDTGDGQASVLSRGGWHLGISSHPRSWNLSLVMSGSEQNNSLHNYANLRVTSVSMSIPYPYSISYPHTYAIVYPTTGYQV